MECITRDGKTSSIFGLFYNIAVGISITYLFSTYKLTVIFYTIITGSPLLPLILHTYTLCILLICYNYKFRLYYILCKPQILFYVHHKVV